MPRRTIHPCWSGPCGQPEQRQKDALTSFCNRPTTRAPTDRSIPRRLAYAEPTACHPDTCSERQYGAGSPCGNPALSGYALDGTLQLWANRLQPHPKGGPSTAPGDAASLWRFRPRARLFDPTSDTPLPAPQDPETGSCKTFRALPFALSSKRATFQARSAFHRQVLPKEPATVLAA